MVGEIWSRLTGAPWTALLVAFISAGIWTLDLGTASYVWILFKEFGGSDFAAFAKIVTGVLLVFLVVRFGLSGSRRRFMRLLVAGGPEGEQALYESAARLPGPKRAEAIALCDAVAGAFSADALIAVLDLPAVAVFAASIFIVSGTAAGGACAGLLAFVAVVLDLAAARSRRLSLKVLDAKKALLAASSEEEAVELAREVYGRRMHLEGAAGTDRDVGVLASGLGTAAAVGVPCMAYASFTGTTLDLIVASLLIGRAVGSLIAAKSALSRMATTMPARRGLDTVLG